MDMPGIEPQGGIHQAPEAGSASSIPPVSAEQPQNTSVRQYPSNSSNFSSSTNPDEDWLKVSDLAERRRIQNRVAQRNYRKKIKERMEELERRAGSDSNKSSNVGSKKWLESYKQQQLHQSSPPPEHQTLQPPSQSGVSQHAFTPPMNPEDHFFPSPSPPPSNPPPFASYQPTYSTPSLAEHTYPFAHVAQPNIQPTSIEPAASTSPNTSFEQVSSRKKVVAPISELLRVNAETQPSSPSFFSEATKFVEKTIQSVKTIEDRVLALEGQRLLPILSEMQSCIHQSDTQTLVSVNPSNIGLTSLDRAKLAIEASTGAEWDWWPLQPPKDSACAGRAELSWQCSCGMKRHESTLPYYANQLKHLFDNFSLFPDISSGPVNEIPSSHSKNSSQGAGSTQSANSSSADPSARQIPVSSSSTANSAITLPDSVVDFGTGPRRYIYVFFLTKSFEYALETIDVSSMKAGDFFQALRAIYNKRRGFWRRAFSVFVYNHCDFIKIIKPEPDTFMPGDLKFELPADHDDEYHYRPRPTYTAPVTKHMFRHYFYGCYNRSALSHRLHTCMPLAPICRIRNPAAELLEYFPKRDRKVSPEAQSDKVEVCYGLAARECRSFFRVVVYLCLIMSPAFWFVFAWLFAWGDRGDLQDATVPMTLTLAVLSILWAVIYSGSDVRNDYGDK